MDQLIQYHPSTLHFDITLNQLNTTELSLKNVSNETIAFKVKTTDVNRYTVRPHADVIKPDSFIVVRFTQQMFHAPPDDLHNCSDRFQLLVIPISLVPAGLLANSPYAGHESISDLWKLAPVNFIVKKKISVTMSLLSSKPEVPFNEHTISVPTFTAIAPEDIKKFNVSEILTGESLPEKAPPVSPTSPQIAVPEVLKKPTFTEPVAQNEKEHGVVPTLEDVQRKTNEILAAVKDIKVKKTPTDLPEMPITSTVALNSSASNTPLSTITELPKNLSDGSLAVHVPPFGIGSTKNVSDKIPIDKPSNTNPLSNWQTPPMSGLNFSGTEISVTNNNPISPLSTLQTQLKNPLSALNFSATEIPGFTAQPTNDTQSNPPIVPSSVPLEVENSGVPPISQTPLVAESTETPPSTANKPNAEDVDASLSPTNDTVDDEDDIDYLSPEYSRSRILSINTTPAMVVPELDRASRQRIAIERAGELVRTINEKSKEIGSLNNELIEARHRLSDARTATRPAYDVRFEMVETSRVPLPQITIMAMISFALLGLLI